MMFSAIGDRIAFCEQANRTPPGSSRISSWMCSTHTSVNRRRAVSWSISTRPSSASRRMSEPSLCRPRRAMSIDSIRDGGALDRLEIAVADHEIILDHAPEGPRGQDDLHRLAAGLGAHGQDDAALAQRQDHAVGPLAPSTSLKWLPSSRSKMATLRSCSTCGLQRTCSSGRAPAPRSDAWTRSRMASSRRSTARACASSPSARARVAAAGPSRAKLAGSQPRRVVRLRKSCTASPEANLAVRAVGRTWLGPPT